ncbi:MAG: hypothetical protein ACK4G4_08900 [Thermus sp.]|uniref:hypothetical protein n=1 Tax=Thermus sp. TaxID=275 RepID=UPI00391C5327
MHQVKEEAWRFLGIFASDLSRDSWPSIRESPSAKEAVGLLDAWRTTAWKGPIRFPKAWEWWAYPILGDVIYFYLQDKRSGGWSTEINGQTLVFEPICLAKALAANILPARTRAFSARMLDSYCIRLEDDELIRLLSLPKKKVQERLYALFLEIAKEFLEQNPHLAPPDPWPTMQRDVFFLAWQEVEGLGLEAIANRLYDRLVSRHPTTRFLLRGAVAKGLSKEAIRKALVFARNRLWLD